jgi:hypothetical protein
MRLLTNAYVALNTRYIRPKQSAGKLKDLTRIACALLAFRTGYRGAAMPTAKTYYAQVPLGIAIKNIEQHQQSGHAEESHDEDKRNPETMRPAGTSARNGAERVQSMSN